MDNDECDIRVEIIDQTKNSFDLQKYRSLTEFLCRRFSIDNAYVSIAIVDDTDITEINEKFLGHKGYTDVISFDLTDENDVKNFEIVVNADQAARQACQRGHQTQAELALYITHGLLHNLGFDDHDPDDAKKMHCMEDVILKEAGFGTVYET